MVDKFNVLSDVEERLRGMGLDFPVDVIETGDRDGEMAIKVTYGPGIFGSQIETLNRFFSTDIFMSFFTGRVNYLKLTDAERASINVHPQVWEAEFLAA